MEQPLPGMPHDVIATQLTRTFDSFATSWSLITADRRTSQTFWPSGRLEGGIAEDYRSANGMGDHPLVRWVQTTGSTKVMASDDVPAEIVDHRMFQAWREAAGPYGIEHQLFIPLFARGIAHRAFVAARPAAAYRPDEMRLAAQIKRLLLVLERQGGGAR